MGSVNSVVVGNFVFATCFICVLLGVLVLYLVYCCFGFGVGCGC